MAPALKEVVAWPLAKDDTHKQMRTLALAQEKAHSVPNSLACCCTGYEPKVACDFAAVMDLRRRGRGETADERLDRLIAMERRARSTPPAEQPEPRRLKVVREQSEGSAASRGGPQGDAAVGGDGAPVGADVAALGDVPRPSHLPLDFGPPARNPDGLLAPLVHGRALQADPGQGGRAGQVPR